MALLRITRLTTIFLLLVNASVTRLHAQNTLIPLTARRDMVFDPSGRYLYITTSDGLVRPYNISTGQLEIGYNLGGSLNGIDITPDGLFLLVAQNNVGGSEGIVHKINLITGAVTNIGFDLAPSEAGAWDVAIASNGLAFVTTQYNGGGWVPLRQIDLATNTVTIRTDWPRWAVLGIEQNTQIHRSADGTLLYFLESSSSNGPVFTYNAVTNIFGPEITTGYSWGCASAAVNRNGTLVATRRGNIVLDTAPNFHFQRAFNGMDAGAAFDPLRDILYAVSGATGEIVAYDTGTFAEEFRFNIGETVIVSWPQFNTGTLVVSPDGRSLALATTSGVRVFALPTTMPAPSPTPTPSLSNPRDMVFDHCGQHLYISTNDGFVFPYNVATATLGTPYDLGGSLRGIDIAPDDSFLLVAQHTVGMTEGTFHKLNLYNGAVTNLSYTREYGDEGGGWNVAIGSNGLALVTTDGPIWTPLREINLVTNAISIRNDPPSSDGYSNRVYRQTHVRRSADRTRFYFLGWNIFTYDAVSNTFGPSARRGVDSTSTEAAINRDGSLLTTRLVGTAFDTAPDFNFIHSFNEPDGGVAFDAVTNTFYALKRSTSEIIAYDTDTFAERYRLPIGAAVPAGTTQFDHGTLVASPDGRYLALRTPSEIRLIAIPSPSPSPTPSPSPSLRNPRKMVFDHSSQHLYITTKEGFVFPYNIATQSLEAPYDLGGSLRGIDISSDDSFLIVAQYYIGVKQSVFQRVDLKTGAVTNIPYSGNGIEFFGNHDVAIASNGLAFGTAASDWALLRQIDLANNIISVRNDTPGGSLYSGANMARSANGTLFCWGSSVFTYDPISDTFGPAHSSLGNASVAINRDATLLGEASYPNYASLITLPSFVSTHTFNGLDSGVAFDAVQDTFYGVNSSNDQIVAYDTNNFSEKFRLDIGEDVNAILASQGTGLLVASQDGQYLALITPATVRIFRVPGLQLLSVVSRKDCGSAGTFDINLPLDGPRGIECRSGGANGSHTLVFSFGATLSAVSNVTATAITSSGTQTLPTPTGSIGTDTHEYIVNLTGVPNACHLTVTLRGVIDSASGTGDISARMDVLLGDVNATRGVDGNDVSAVQAHTRQTASQSNCRFDVNTTGAIDGNDVSLTQSATRTSLP